MAFSQATFGVIDQVIDRIFEKQPKRAEKSNTLTTAIGGGITAALTFIAYVAEAGTTLPGWTPVLVSVLGILATILGVSQTRNGLTKSTIAQIKNEVQEMIDAQEGQKVTPQVPDPVAPVVAQPGVTVQGAENIADDLDAIAKRIAAGG